MADKYVTDILVKWQLESLVEHFKDNGIDQHSFDQLTDDVIKELIPSVGFRIKFIEKWKKHDGKQPVCAVPKSTDQHDSDTNSVASSSSDYESDQSQKEQLPPNKPKRQRCFVGESMYRMVTRPPVQEILEASMQGRAILKSYKKTKELTRQSRAIIVDIIITDTLKDLKGPLRNEDFNHIAKDIVKVFPTELRSTYYIAPVKKQFARTNKPVTSRGRLVDKYRNKLRQYKRLSRSTLASETSASTSTSAQEDENISADVKEMKTWLQTNQEPWELAISYWKATSSIRINEIKKQDTKLIDILEGWPLLRHPKGYTLIHEDFDNLHLDEVKNAIDKWDGFINNIQTLCSPKNNNVGLELAKLLKSEDLSDDGKTAVQFSLLPYLIPPKGRLRTKTSHWKPSMDECENSLLMHAKIPRDVSRIQESRVTCMANFGLTVQPYVIVVGPTLESISTVFVSIDNILYQVPSVVTAIDTCFKAFYALNLLYPPQAEHIWYLIQVGLYNISSKNDKKISYVLEILSALDY